MSTRTKRLAVGVGSLGVAVTLICLAGTTGQGAPPGSRERVDRIKVGRSVTLNPSPGYYVQLTNIRVSERDDQMVVSFDSAIWNDAATPITQVFISLGRRIVRKVYHGVPPKRPGVRKKVSFSFARPSCGANYTLYVGMTLAKRLDQGVDHYEAAEGGHRAPFCTFHVAP
ncbi:MAG: hypothetical protein GWP05_04905 [Anaerolineaceae bacterium]|nr:hypothetical protein [Anaerolineaceae bacterium]